MAQGAVRIHQDARLYGGLFDGAETATVRIAPGRRAWLQLARATLQVQGTALAAGDGAFSHEPGELTLHGAAGAEVLVFDLP